MADDLSSAKWLLERLTVGEVYDKDFQKAVKTVENASESLYEYDNAFIDHPHLIIQDVIGECQDKKFIAEMFIDTINDGTEESRMIACALRKIVSCMGLNTTGIIEELGRDIVTEN